MEPITLQDGTQLDPKVVKVMKTIRTLEGGKYDDRTGDNGSSAGAYQWNNDNKPLTKGELPSHWKNAAKEILGDENSPMTPANQNKVAYSQIKAYKDAGKTPEEIDALWNGAHVDKTTGKYVHNSEDRAKKFRETILKGNTNQQNNHQPFSDSLKDLPQSNKNIDNPSDPGNVLSDLSKGDYGNALKSGMGNVGGFIDKTVKPFEDIAAIPLQAGVAGINALTGSHIKDPYSQEGIPGFLGNQKLSEVSDVEGKLKSGLQAGLTTATTASLGGGIGLLGKSLSSGKALLGKELPLIIKEVSPELAKAFESETASGKFNLLTDLLNKVPPAEKKVLQKSLEELTPLVEKEQGLTPGLLKNVLIKTGGLIKKSAKGLIGAGIGGILGGTALGVYNHLTK